MPLNLVDFFGFIFHLTIRTFKRDWPFPVFFSSRKWFNHWPSCSYWKSVGRSTWLHGSVSGTCWFHFLRDCESIHFSTTSVPSCFKRLLPQSSAVVPLWVSWDLLSPPPSAGSLENMKLPFYCLAPEVSDSSPYSRKRRGKPGCRPAQLPAWGSALQIPWLSVWSPLCMLPSHLPTHYSLFTGMVFSLPWSAAASHPSYFITGSLLPGSLIRAPARQLHCPVCLLYSSSPKYE